MNSHFKNFEKGNTGKIGVWGIKNKKERMCMGRTKTRIAVNRC